MGNCCDCANERQNAREAYGIYPEKQPLSLLQTDDAVQEEESDGIGEFTKLKDQFQLKGDKASEKFDDETLQEIISSMTEEQKIVP